MHVYIVLKAVSVSPYQQPADLPLPTGTGDGRSRGDFSPSLLFLVGAATSCRCLAGRQSYLCRLKWRWHRPLSCPHSAPSVAGECWAGLLAPAAARWKEKSGSRAAVPMQHINTLQVKSHKRGQPGYLQQQSSRCWLLQWARGIFTGMGS